MKARVQKDNLVAGLATVTRAAMSRPVLPVLGMILLEAYQDSTEVGSRGGLRLTGTDLKVRLEHRIEAQVEIDGSMVVPYRLFQDLATAMPDDLTTLEVKEGLTLLMANSDGRTRSNIKGLDANEFPTTTKRNVHSSMTIPTCGEFLDAVKQVAFAADQTEGSRPVLEGVFMILNGSRITLVAADGYRLAVRKLHVPLIQRDQIEEEWSALIPARSLAHLPAVVKNTDVPLVISILGNEGVLSFECGPIRMMTQTVSGKYFDWPAVIPVVTPLTRTVTVDIDPLRRAVRAMAVFGRTWGKPIIHLTFGPESKVTIQGRAHDEAQGSAVVDAEIEGGEGPPLTIALNADFLDGALKSARLNSQSARLEATAPTSPVAIRPVAGDDLTHVVMPSQISQV